jgi:hypothetical protein
MTTELTTTTALTAIGVGTDLNSLVASLRSLSVEDQTLILSEIGPDLREAYAREFIGADVALAKIGREKANDILVNSNYGLQRDRRPKYIQSIVEEMLAGRWQRSIIMVCYVGEDYYLIDGQNRLAAIVISGIEQEFLVIKRFCKDLQEVRDIYSVQDIGLKRQQCDILRAQINGSDDHTLDEKQLGTVGTAIRVLMSGFNGTSARTTNRIPNDTMMKRIFQFEAAGDAFFSCLEGEKKDRKRFNGSPVMALALATFDGAAKKAHDFWEEVSMGGGLNGSPTAQAYDIIMNNLVDTLNVGVMSRLLALTWNAYYDGTTLPAVPVTADVTTLVDGRQKLNPIRIAGTAFDGEGRTYLTDEGTYAVEPDQDTVKAAAAKQKEEAKATLEAEKAEQRKQREAERALAAAAKEQEKADKEAAKVTAAAEKEAAKVEAAEAAAAAKLKAQEDKEAAKAIERAAKATAKAERDAAAIIAAASAKTQDEYNGSDDDFERGYTPSTVDIEEVASELGGDDDDDDYSPRELSYLDSLTAI